VRNEYRRSQMPVFQTPSYLKAFFSLPGNKKKNIFSLDEKVDVKKQKISSSLSYGWLH
jgi:hypothetical protein